ncbi:GNAT family N-acetyltransferase [Tengunoibacter tsumagoiensis]|uniref:Acetyltransferase n=1 Tax=Tengunoibacter tsumagoiensis TaxID=2014871 RepID=A0A401ZU99_9CHLR|nr:GNAT family N-acetyltransferase [Tengunoibacter tsumagoiensis]GCE10441.1 acetyltransferase [Tengunoibacter tsumagoiensis]
MQLSSERLVLREFTEQDWPVVLTYQSNPDYLRFYPWETRNELEVRSFVRMFIDWSREQPRKKYQVAITLKENGQLIGNCGLRMQSANSGIAELGYEIDRHYWGHGYATEAATLLLRFGFERLALHRIWAYCIAENIASAHVLEKIGMSYEGCLRESEWMKERWWNTLYYAILDYEWQTRS